MTKYGRVLDIGWLIVYALVVPRKPTWEEVVELDVSQLDSCKGVMVVLEEYVGWGIELVCLVIKLIEGCMELL